MARSSFAPAPRTFGVCAAGLLLAVLCGCATTRPVTGGRHSEVGTASYYGTGFQGRRTASGERFDMHEMTAAHPTLAFGTQVRVTNLENGRRVVVRINDRGPFRKGRIIDVSREAARALGFASQGTAKVKVERI